MGSYLEKYGQFWKNGHFSGRIWPDRGHTAWADIAGLGSIGLNFKWNAMLISLVAYSIQCQIEARYGQITIGKGACRVLLPRQSTPGVTPVYTCYLDPLFLFWNRLIRIGSVYLRLEPPSS